MKIGKGNEFMLTDNQKHEIVEALKKISNPSELEKDIIDTMKELSKQSLDWNGALARIYSNYNKYNDLYIKVNALPTTTQKAANQIKEMDLRYLLQMQLNFLLQKEEIS